MTTEKQRHFNVSVCTRGLLEHASTRELKLDIRKLIRSMEYLDSEEKRDMANVLSRDFLSINPIDDRWLLAKHRSYSRFGRRNNLPLCALVDRSTILFPSRLLSKN